MQLWRRYSIAFCLLVLAEVAAATPGLPDSVSPANSDTVFVEQLIQDLKDLRGYPRFEKAEALQMSERLSNYAQIQAQSGQTKDALIALSFSIHFLSSFDKSDWGYVGQDSTGLEQRGNIIAYDEATAPKRIEYMYQLAQLHLTLGQCVQAQTIYKNMLEIGLHLRMPLNQPHMLTAWNARKKPC
jgi:hypothetical protein